VSRLHTASYGAGVQSTAMLVLAAQGKIEPRLFIFANVGDDSEHPDSLGYFREIATPYAAEHGIELVEVQRTWKRGERAGTTETLRSRLDRGRSAIPVRRTVDGPPMSRSCTADFKVAPIGDELRRRGATADNPARVALGISTDEIERAKPGIDPRSPYQERVYPLLDLGLRRVDCMEIIEAAGLPVPVKSSCFFCPFHSNEAWRLLARNEPHLFAEAQQIEATLSAKSSDGRPVYLTRHGKPLGDAIDTSQGSFDSIDGCDSGWCMT
jgi:hypothetical protein